MYGNRHQGGLFSCGEPFSSPAFIIPFLFLFLFLFLFPNQISSRGQVTMTLSVSVMGFHRTRGRVALTPSVRVT
jgi:hypothetical protein